MTVGSGGRKSASSKVFDRAAPELGSIFDFRPIGCPGKSIVCELKLEFHGAKVTSDAGLIPFRELDEALGMTELAENAPHDTCRGMNTRAAPGALEMRKTTIGTSRERKRS